MDILIASGAFLCVIVVVGLAIVLVIISFFLPIFRRGTRQTYTSERFINRPAGNARADDGRWVGDVHSYDDSGGDGGGDGA